MFHLPDGLSEDVEEVDGVLEQSDEGEEDHAHSEADLAQASDADVHARHCGCSRNDGDTPHYDHLQPTPQHCCHSIAIYKYANRYNKNNY